MHSCCNYRHGRHLLHISVTIVQRNYRPLSPTIIQSFFFIVRFEKFHLKDKGRCAFRFVNGNLSTTCAHKYAWVLNWIFGFHQIDLTFSVIPLWEGWLACPASESGWTNGPGCSPHQTQRTGLEVAPHRQWVAVRCPLPRTCMLLLPPGLLPPRLQPTEEQEEEEGRSETNWKQTWAQKKASVSKYSCVGIYKCDKQLLNDKRQTNPV